MIEYNEERPHDALGDLTPVEARQKAPLEILVLNCRIAGEAYVRIQTLDRYHQDAQAAAWRHRRFSGEEDASCPTNPQDRSGGEFDGTATQ